MQDVVHLPSLERCELIKKMVVGIKFHVFIFESLDAGECVWSKVFAKGESVHGLCEFFIDEEEDKAGEVEEEDEFIALDENEVAVVKFLELFSQELDELEESGREVV